ALGVEVGLRFCVLTRPSREEAVEIADSLIPECQIGMWGKGRDQRDDSVMYEQSAKLKESWLSPTIWTGLVPLCGPVWATLLGTPREVADLLLEYRRIGVSQFILSGWPEIEEVARFGNDVLPLVREGERKLAAA
ncbi:MAG: alkanesulfonate monooxygenase, partial [Limisphaerales bacterium]